MYFYCFEAMQKCSSKAFISNIFLFFLISAYRGRSVSSEHDNSESEQTEKSPLVSAKLETFTRFLFSRTTSNFSQDNTNYSNNSARDNNSSPTR